MGLHHAPFRGTGTDRTHSWMGPVTPSLTYVLKEVPEERVTEVLPALQAVSMDKPMPPGPVDEPLPLAVQEAIERFIAMQHLSTACVKSQYQLGD